MLTKKMLSVVMQAMSNPYSTMVGASSSRANWQAALRSLFMVVNFRGEGRWSRTNHIESTSRANLMFSCGVLVVTDSCKMVCFALEGPFGRTGKTTVLLLRLNGSWRALSFGNGAVVALSLRERNRPRKGRVSLAELVRNAADRLAKRDGSGGASHATSGRRCIAVNPAGGKLSTYAWSWAVKGLATGRRSEW